MQRAGQGNIRVRRQPCIHRCAVMGRTVAAQVRRSRSSCSLKPSRLLGVSLAWAGVASGLSRCRATAIAIERATFNKTLKSLVLERGNEQAWTGRLQLERCCQLARRACRSSQRLPASHASATPAALITLGSRRAKKSRAQVAGVLRRIEISPQDGGRSSLLLCAIPLHVLAARR